MAGSDRWYFGNDFLANTPSRRCGIDADKELSYRQQAANLIQDMGQRLHVTQLCINTAIVYMHRFYTFHSFTKFHRNSISSCALFLAAKVEEQPRKLEHVIKVSYMCLHRESQALDVKSEAYQEQAMELVFNENLMLQTLGFDIAVEHPHTSVVNCCQLVRASKDLAQTSYFMATNSLHLTTMCLQHKPTVVACVCIHLACKWSSWEIPRSSEGKDWFYYVDKSVTLELLEQLTKEFLAILDKCPSRLKRKILSGSGGNASTSAVTHNSSMSSSKPNNEKKNSLHLKEESKPTMPSKSSSHLTTETTAPANSTTRRSPPTSPLMKKVKSESSGQQPNKIPVPMSYAAYRERKERANTQSDAKQQSEQQLIKSNNKSLNRDIVSNQPKDRLSAKQQLIIDKQRQSDERNRFKTKNTEYLFESTGSRPTNPLKTNSSLTHQKYSQNNSMSEDFYDLLNKPSNFNSIFSTEGDDSFDCKRDIASDLKMEFSDNSNQSNDGLNLPSFTSDFMNDSEDSKKSLNNSKIQTNVESKPTSFMDIFSTPIAATNSIPVPSKSDNIKTNIPPKYEDIQSVLSRLKPEPPPPMLSPLKSTTDLESISKPFPSHSSSVPPPLKTNTNLNSSLDSKQIQNLKNSKNSPKSRNPFPHKNSMTLSAQSLRDKELNGSSLSVKLEDNFNPIPIIGPIDMETNISVNNNNKIINNYETTETIQMKPEIIEKPSKAAEVPSVLGLNRPQISSHSEFDIKPNVESLVDSKSSVFLSPNSQMLLNNTNAMPESGANRYAVIEVKEPKEKHSQEEKHHKHSHHSHKSSKHKDKHKHKHKDKDREKHKRKDKDRDRERDKDRERHRDKGHEVKDDPSFNISNTAPIKLKISKKKLSCDEPERDNQIPPNPQNSLKLRIQLKDQKLTANPTEFESNDMTSQRKRKSSPKSSKKEKQMKYELNFKQKDDKNVSKMSSKSKKSNEKSNETNNSVSDEKRLNANNYINSFGGQPLLGTGGQTLTTGQQPTQRSSKAHK